MTNGYRHELKYLINRKDAELLKIRLKGIMDPDSHAGPSGKYTIRSLYFDDFAGTAFYEKLDGVAERTKYRIRYYDYDASLIKLERKEKIGNLTRKTAQTLTQADARVLEAGAIRPCPDHPDGLARELRLACMCRGLRPKVLVDYDRTPFVCRDGNTRITLDENLRTLPFDAQLFSSTRAMIPVLEPHQVILEVKFDDYLPGYLRDALADIPKAPMAISKFAFCMNYL
jgi:hypothetical protein